MFKKIVSTSLLWGVCAHFSLFAHCQMPCGIYHDEMVYDQIDQYVETMVKGISVLQDNKFSTVQDRNVFVRWVMEKDTASDQVADVLTEYFLQQKIKPGDPDTAKRVLSCHKLLFLLVQIKQNADLKIVNDFYEEWEKFKLMFHIEGYKCKVSQAKLEKWKQQQIQKGQPVNKQSYSEEDHDHDHDHDHDQDGNHTH